MSKTPLFTRCLREAQSEQRKSVHLAVRKQAMLLLPEVKAAFRLLPPALRKQAWLSVDTSIITIGVSLKKLRSFKDPRLTRVLSRLLEADFYADKTYDWANEKEPERDYTFQRTLYGANDALANRLPHATKDYFDSHYIYGAKDPLVLRVTVYAYVREDSPLCKSVVVGTEQRVVTDIIRKIVCA